MTASPLTLVQHTALRVAKKTRLHGATARLFHPRCTLRWSDALPGLYEEVFIREDYAPPAPLPPRPRILDLGGFLGLAAIYFMWRFPDCRLTCVEPNPYSFASMEKAVTGYARSCGAEVRALNKAVGVVAGTATLVVDAGEPVNVAASLTERAGAAGNMLSVPVEVTGLSSLLAAGVDFMKMDIEGMEYPVFESGIINPATIRCFAVELHDVERQRERTLAIAQTLADQGYHAVGWTGRPLSPEDIAALDGCQVVRFHIPG